MSETTDIDEQLAAFREAEGDNLSDAGGHQVHARSFGSSALVIKIGQDAERLISAVIATISRTSWLNALAGIGLLVLGWFSYCNAREARMLEYYVMELDARVIAAGIVKPDESWTYRKSHPEEKQP